MKKTYIAAVILCMLPTIGIADGVPQQTLQVQATVYDIQPIYENVRVDYYENVCKNVRRKGNQLEGAIIGGIIGNQFGNGDGKDAMTVLGAIIGADSAGYNETRCQIEKVTYNEPAFVAWSVHWKWNQHTGKFQTNDYYVVGDKVFIEFE